jgi:hypothetical protein
MPLAKASDRREPSLRRNTGCLNLGHHRARDQHFHRSPYGVRAFQGLFSEQFMFRLSRVVEK